MTCRAQAPLATTLFCIAQLVSAVAAAETRQVPAKFVARDLVVPGGTVMINGGPRWPFPEGQLVMEFGDNTNAWMNAGATFGVTRDLHLGGVVPLQLASEINLRDPRVYMVYQFLRGGVDVGVFVQANLPFEGPFQTLAGLPMQFALGGSARLDTGPFLYTAIVDDGEGGDDITGEFILPFNLPINLTGDFFLGPEFGLATANEFHYVRLPLGFFMGYTIVSGTAPTGDISLRFRDLNARDFGSVFHIILAVDIYFDL